MADRKERKLVSEKEGLHEVTTRNRRGFALSEAAGLSAHLYRAGSVQAAYR